ncbi:MAG TPA: hypothetical protein VIV40_05610 [Kofleriaceae bacterium]
MRRLVCVLSVVAACGGDPSAPSPQTFEFGPYTLAPGQEITGQCVSATLNNETPLYVNAVELTTGPGFHHSNWFWVPDNTFVGADGTWRCDDRAYDEAVAGLQGGVLFAQSTQAQHEVQAFPIGAATVVPPHSRILAGTHLLNTGDAAVTLSLKLTITPIAEPTTILTPTSLVNESIALPPHRVSHFTMDCDIDKAYRNVTGMSPTFSFYYALAHYHDLGRGLTIEAVKTDGSATTIFSTTNAVGDALGGTIDPAFSLAGYQKVRFMCAYDNPRDTTVTWGVGDKEMCTFLAWTDSEYTWTGGVLSSNETPTITDFGDYIEYAYPCAPIGKLVE